MNKSWSYILEPAARLRSKYSQYILGLYQLFSVPFISPEGKATEAGIMPTGFPFFTFHCRFFPAKRPLMKKLYRLVISCFPCIITNCLSSTSIRLRVRDFSGGVVSIFVELNHEDFKMSFTIICNTCPEITKIFHTEFQSINVFILISIQNKLGRRIGNEFR